ncbi:TIGR02391 family protein [Chloroflexota bacterium]
MSSNRTPAVATIRAILQQYLGLFSQYSAEIFGSRERVKLDEIRGQLQRMEPRVTDYLLQINGDGVIALGSFGVRRSLRYRDLMGTATMGGNNELPHNFADFHNCVESVINGALGRIDAGLWPPKTREPILTINDPELEQRCLDLLQAPGKFDRVVREATLILEDRLRNTISLERLTVLIPESAKQTGEHLVNILLSPKTPVMSISTNQQERAAFHRIMLGVFSYLRNPFHHQIDDAIDWSWSWSIVGFIDHLLHELQNCTELK